MGALFKKYRLEVIKETSSIYEVEKKINKPADINNIAVNVYNLDRQAEEVLLLLTINTKNEVIGAFEVHRGSLNSSIVHPREIFKRALMMNASRIVICHNHPSGDPTPSGEDINITNRIKECGALMGIELLDHVIIGDDRYKSLKKIGVV